MSHSRHLVLGSGPVRLLSLHALPPLTLTPVLRSQDLPPELKRLISEISRPHDPETCANPVRRDIIQVLLDWLEVWDVRG